VHKREEEEIYETAFVCVYLMDNTVSLCGCFWEHYFHGHTLKIVSIFIMINGHLFVWFPIYLDDHSLDLLLLNLLSFVL